VRAVAGHKGASGGNKIELFYFLPQGWIDRTIKSWRNDVEDRCRTWWGNDGVMDFLKLCSFDRGMAMAKRFKVELGYKHSYPFPIQKEGERGSIMFWMIHASDHDRATTLMMQAYRYIGAGGGLDEPVEQMELL
jgi:three-Cys-motif partner protein